MRLSMRDRCESRRRPPATMRHVRDASLRRVRPWAGCGAAITRRRDSPVRRAGLRRRGLLHRLGRGSNRGRAGRPGAAAAQDLRWEFPVHRPDARRKPRRSPLGPPARRWHRRLGRPGGRSCPTPRDASRDGGRDVGARDPAAVRGRQDGAAVRCSAATVSRCSVVCMPARSCSRRLPVTPKIFSMTNQPRRATGRSTS
jgi:hypothetical protein